MKIEIDLNDILGDEYGAETLGDSVRRQIVESLQRDISRDIRNKINEETARIMNDELQKALKDQMPALLADVMNSEYRPVSSYGEKGNSTTFRAELIKAVAKECTYAPRSSSYDENAFTKGIKLIVEEQMKIFKKEWDAKITDKFRADCLTYAVGELSKRLGLTK